MNMKYCDDHACWHKPGKCPKCKTGEPGYVRNKTEVNPNNKRRITNLKKRGLFNE